ncbi:HAD-IIA family hydrolase [Natronosalvus rutilus]|uniref:HAD-IIA family hydrolase n=1 Tax=Natronosalvus rutilus TaxID=2953753 RepID=A0A9E7N8G8_9EURY|nr:HAD-IIA family hydrolase [Natronosalvus rutilus]UTF53684.1 HAD-IIA family hydrolase [Natronosalvus rutilus]
MTRYEAVILDVDGTLVRGDRLLPGAATGIRAIDDAGCDRLLFSNNPTRGAAHYEERLSAHDLAVDPRRVLTSGTVAAEFLADTHPEASVFVVGESRLEALLEAASLAVTDDPREAAVVLGSIDRDLTYDDLGRALTALECADAFYGTDPDVTIPTDGGMVPGSGTIIAAMEAVAEREVDGILGKPSKTAADAAFERLGLEGGPERTLVVGDRLNTDIELGARAGTDTALVTTGVASRADVAAADLEPTYVLDSLAELEDVLG